MKKALTILFLLFTVTGQAFAYDTYNSPEFFRHYGKQQIKVKNSKGNTVYTNPNYNGYDKRNEVTSEKVVAIYDKHAPEGAYGVRYIIYTPIGKYIGHRRMVQPSPNGYGFDPIWDGGEFSKTPCFKTIEEAKRYYYPSYFKPVATTKPVLRN